MSKRVALTLWFVGVFPAILNAHQFYISITTIQHHADSEKLTITVKLFVNDLEESIYQEKGVRIGLWQNQPIVNAQSYVEQYIASKFAISINDKLVPLKFISQRLERADIIEDHVIICQLEANHISEITTVKVRNSLLIETIDSQANIVNILANDTRKAINLDRRIQEDQITYR